MRKRQKRIFEENSLSFLDVISCGFGAIVLLLLIIKVTAPGDEKENLMSSALSALTIEELQSKEQTMKHQVDSNQKLLDEQSQKLTQITNQLNKKKKAVADSGIAAMANEKIKGQLQSALQSLDAEMQTLKIKSSSKVGGIPVDSHYVIFIIDTSSSMQDLAWAKMKEQMTAILGEYPQLKGIQVINDMGSHLFEGFRNRWIKDTPAMRKRILRSLNDWSDFSNSNPVEGIYEAISRYAKKSSKLSLYVMGDDFSGSVQSVLDRVDQLNRSMKAKKIRIHAVGFFTPGVTSIGYLRFASLSALTRRNYGTFIGISTRE